MNKIIYRIVLNGTVALPLLTLILTREERMKNLLKSCPVFPKTFTFYYLAFPVLGERKNSRFPDVPLWMNTQNSVSRFFTRGYIFN